MQSGSGGQWGGGVATPQTEESALYMSEEEEKALVKEIRDRVTTSYTTIALVSALLSAVSFAAYSTPPGELFTATGAAPTTPPPAPMGLHNPPGWTAPPPPHGWRAITADTESAIASINWDGVINVIYSIMWHIYGIVMPLAFVFNLLGTLSASGVILYANSTLATDHAILKQFNNRSAEHSIIKFPAAFLVFGVLFLFAGFSLGITLFYGLVIGFALNFGSVFVVVLYEMFFAPASHGDAFSDMALSIAALFFRSCCHDFAAKADKIYEKGVQDKVASKQRAAVARAMAEADRRGYGTAPQIVVDPGDETRGMRKKGCC